MSEFLKYMHVERFGNDEVQGIELGECFIFPKLDGTNSQVWVDVDKNICCGSRNRQLSLDNDNAGFMAHIIGNDTVSDLLSQFPQLRLYGEWLVPHSLKTYREDAWRKFYVFDVFDNSTGKFLHFSEYSDLCDSFDVCYISPIRSVKNVTYDALLKDLDKNTFCIRDGEGVGEGVVIKNYDYENRFGRVVWAKIVTTVFKEKHTKEMGAPSVTMKPMVEQEFCDKHVTIHLVDKVYAKIANECEGWNSRYIPRLLSTVFYDLVNEELWNFVKASKMPTINFKTLNCLTTMKIKELKPELF